MKVNEVPQDRHMMQEGVYEVCYAVDEKGRYVMTPSVGWEPKNIANDQAWELIRQEIEQALQGIRNGRLSPLAFHMANNQMSIGLLAKYVKLNRWRVRRHLKPEVFKRLKPDILKRYAAVFDLPVEQLIGLPRRQAPAEDSKDSNQP